MISFIDFVIRKSIYRSWNWLIWRFFFELWLLLFWNKIKYYRNKEKIYRQKKIKTIFRNSQSLQKINEINTRRNLKNISKLTKFSLVTIFEIYIAKLFVKSNISIAQNFYIVVIISYQNITIKIMKCLINKEITINLISRRIIDAFHLTLIIDSKTFIRLTNDIWEKLLNSIWITITIIEINIFIHVLIISKKTTFTILLKRFWLRAIKILNVYEKNEYKIKNKNENLIKLKSLSISIVAFSFKIKLDKNIN